MAKRSTPFPTRRTASVAAVLATTALLAGCSATNPITTDLDYDPSDGVGERLGDVRVGNMMVLTAEEGAAGTVVGFVANEGRQDASVVLTVGEEQSDAIDVPAGSTVLLGPDADETVDVEAVPAIPGSKLAVTLTTDVAGATTLQVPVLDSTLPEYADLVP
ncbi:hypothetical protein [Actinotalea sp. Marseille-Q4924]|uniref:hypothetical protein n=1 Tax=Actinotalea sp. Marseille-Q4924 TaxID=2866571 RepID=UPI001CE48587|nr:hypothetical protein [Actinotalea sp. Marseille-Q4924]